MDIFKVRGNFVYAIKCSGPTDEPGWEDEWWVDEEAEYTVKVKADSLEEAIAKAALEIKEKGIRDHKTRMDGFRRVEIIYVCDIVYGKRELGYIDVEELVREFLSLLGKEELSRLISSISNKK